MASILCVDDNKAFLQSMGERLRAENYDVDEFDSAEAALAAFQRNPFKYDVVITDVDLQGGDDGEALVTKLIELREIRGYDPSPEIICITGARSKMDAKLVNRIRERGCHYVLKGTDQYYLEIQAAVIRLREMRGKGPQFLFVHSTSEEYAWQNNGKWGCKIGESVNEVFLLHSGARVMINLAPAPRRLFDFFARRTARRPFSLEEVANAVALDEFYSYWETGDETVTSDAIKNNVRRIRMALRVAFKSAKIPIEAERILSTESIDHTDLYRFRGRATVEHVP